MVNRYAERAALILLFLLGVVPRLELVSKFPTIPFSDFGRLVAFGVHLSQNGPTANTWLWDYFNPGMPLVLAGVFKLAPCLEPGAVARVATAFACGMMGLLPFVIWRGALPFWVRVSAGAALAVWPGQVMFSGTVAQDNWVLLPGVALAAFAIRAWFTDEPPRLITAGLLYGAGVAMRQEMLVVLLPLFLMTARVKPRMAPRRIIAAGLALVLPLIALAAYRQACTGRFALSSEHGGYSALGSYIPGATVNAWADPFPFIASVRPDLLRNRRLLLSESWRLAAREALRRPGFQAARITSSLLSFARGAEAASLYWCLGAAEALPEGLRQKGAALADRAGFPLCYELLAIHALFLAALIFAVRWRSVPVLMLAAAVALKYLVHAVTVPQPRYFFVATAFEILAIAVAAYQFRKDADGRKWRLLPPALAAGLVIGGAIFWSAPRIAAAVQRRDTDGQRTYRFFLQPSDGGADLNCVMNRGLLMTLAPGQRATMRTMLRDPAPGDTATADCQLTGSGAQRPLTLQVLDPYAPGGFPDRLLQRVEVDGREVFSHDIARDPGSGWADVPLGEVGAGTNKKVVIEVRAVRPDAGPGWGDAARTTFQLSRGETKPQP